MNWKVIIRNIGFALLVNALFMLFSIFVSMANGNDSALAALMISFTITFIVGIFPFIFVRKANSISLREGYVIITLSWLLSFLFGLLPYVLWGGPFTLSNAIFESVSGYTTCGGTILSDVEALPDSLLFWRSSTHFIGGLGVVVFLLLIIPESSQMRMRLTNMELSSLTRSGYSSRTTGVVYIFAYVYIALVVLAAVAYMLAGMTPFDAVCHAMAVVATGGFSTKTASIAAFDSYWIEGITMLFMYLSSIHFGLLYLSVISRSLKPLKSPIIKFPFAQAPQKPHNQVLHGIRGGRGRLPRHWAEDRRLLRQLVRGAVGRAFQHPDRLLDHRLRQSRQLPVALVDGDPPAFPGHRLRNHGLYLRWNQVRQCPDLDEGHRPLCEFYPASFVGQ